MKKLWIIGLVLLVILISIVGVKIYIKSNEAKPGWWMLNQPRLKLLQENVALSPGETRVVPCIIETLYFPAEENFLKNFLEIYWKGEWGRPEELPMPEGLMVVLPLTPRVEPYENLLVWITIATTPELEPREYVFEVGGSAFSSFPGELTVIVE
ncbi:MAG: hypothetical protein ACETWO_05545 [Candidatus Hadarchaeaceae archaeon]